MKKFLVLSALCAVGLTLSAVDQIRVDIHAIRDMTICDINATNGLYIAVQNPKNVKEDITKAYIYSKSLTAEWQDFEISFVPEEDGRVRLLFQTPGSRNVASIKPVWVDDVQITGVKKFQNGNFETLKNGKITGWRLGANAKVISGKAAEGSNCIQIIYGKGSVFQNLNVSADTKVTIKFKARLAE